MSEGPYGIHYGSEKTRRQEAVARGSLRSFSVQRKWADTAPKRADDGTWCVPAGSIELGETPEETARREFLEETGLTLGELKLQCILSGEDSHFFYPNGDEAYAVDINFVCREYSGEMKPQESEVLELSFFDTNDLPEGLNKNDRKVIESIVF